MPCGGPALSRAQVAEFEARSALSDGVVANNAEYSATIKVHFHVVMFNDTVRGGLVEDSQIADQITAINNVYGPTGVKFELVNTTRTYNTAWFRNRDHNEMKRSLRAGDEGSLNIFTTGPDPGQDYGFATSTFPMVLPDRLPVDGIVLSTMYLPGGTDESDNKGNRILHELGHWLGLYDIQEGGCIPESDYVDDTPSTMRVWYGANPCLNPDFRPDSCPELPGEDPVRNVMFSGIHGDCAQEITPGQVTRIRKQLARWRGITGNK